MLQQGTTEQGSPALRLWYRYSIIYARHGQVRGELIPFAGATAAGTLLLTLGQTRFMVPHRQLPAYLPKRGRDKAFVRSEAAVR